MTVYLFITDTDNGISASAYSTEALRDEAAERYAQANYRMTLDEFWEEPADDDRLICEECEVDAE